MKILSVYPITRGISKERLTYFSSSEVAPGTIVSVPLRKKMVPAIVVSSDDAEDLKSELRASSFALRKIGKVQSSLLSPGFVKAAEETADHFASTTGAVLAALTPKHILENARKAKASEAGEVAAARERLALQTNDEERFSHYKSLIREEFARKRSVFFLLPTIEDLRRVRVALEKGIENYTFVLHSGLTPKEQLARWNEIATTPHPVLVIGTAQFLSLHRGDLKTIVIEKESSRAYKTPARPYLDMRVFAHKLAEQTGARLVVGDVLLRTETIYAERNDEYVDLSPLKFRSLSTAEMSLVDMRNESDEENKKFRVFSNEIEALVRETKEKNQRAFLFASRKGFATSTLCADCGEIVRCTNCGAPVALFQLKVDENYFFCNKCGEKRAAHEKCRNCGSWNLTMIGIGVERVEDELARNFPDVKVFRLDKESVKTEKRALEIVERFYESPGSVLIGTELALIYLHSKVENAGVISLDSLFAVPDFRINEKLFHILLQIRDLAERKFVLQTRNASERIFAYATQGNLMDFYRDEINARKEFLYPPWSIFIKITLEGPRAAVEARMRKLKEYLQPFEANLFPSFDVPGARTFAMHALIKLKTEEWPNTELLEKLRRLPPHYRIKIDPDTLI